MRAARNPGAQPRADSAFVPANGQPSERPGRHRAGPAPVFDPDRNGAGLGAAGGGSDTHFVGAADWSLGPVDRPPTEPSEPSPDPVPEPLDRPRGSQDRSGGRGRHARRPERTSRLTLAKELPLLVGIALVLALLIKTFLVQAFFIPSDSMENTLKVGDRVLVNKIGQHFGEIERGEVVVFRDPGGWLSDGEDDSSGNPISRSIKNVLIFVGLLPSDSEQDLIKRVVGIPGDRVACCDEQGRVTVNGIPLEETYIYPGNAPSDITFDVQVPEGRLFVMGDHRSVSADSRVHLAEPGFGTIPENNVIGRAFVKVWPPSRIGGLPVPDTFGALAAAGASPLVIGLALAVPLLRLRQRRDHRHLPIL